MSIRRGEVIAVIVTSISEEKIVGSWEDVDGRNYEGVFELSSYDNRDFIPEDIKIGSMLDGKVCGFQSNYELIMESIYGRYGQIFKNRKKLFRTIMGQIEKQKQTMLSPIEGYLSYVSDLEKYFFVSKETLQISKEDCDNVIEFFNTKGIKFDLNKYLASWCIANKCYMSSGIIIQKRKIIAYDSKFPFLSSEILFKLFPIEEIVLTYDKNRNTYIVNNELGLKSEIEDLNLMEVGFPVYSVNINMNLNIALLGNPFVKYLHFDVDKVKKETYIRNMIQMMYAPFGKKYNLEVIEKLKTLSIKYCDYIRRGDIEYLNFEKVNNNVEFICDSLKKQRYIEHFMEKEQGIILEDCIIRTKRSNERRQLEYETQSMEERYGYDEDAMMSSPEYWENLYE